MAVYTAYMTAMAMTGEHPQDVLGQLATWQTSGDECALVIITGTEGGAVRAPGALMAVSSEASLGYISGGCIDADVILQARQAMRERAPRQLRYGAGSPFVDLPLPCGGAIEAFIIPNPDPIVVRRLSQRLNGRQSVQLIADLNGALFDGEGSNLTSSGPYQFFYEPKLRLRIAGRGADALALAKISDAAGYETHLQLLDDEDIKDAQRAGLKQIVKLGTVKDLPPQTDDPWTAFILLFHDRDLEIPLLGQAMAGPAFYIGAVGSRRTHSIRCDHLRNAGFSDVDIGRIHGPIGLVPSLRNASSIAISTLAEIIDVSRTHAFVKPSRTAFVLLAAGASRRFESGDKLMAELDGKPVLAHAATLTRHPSVACPIAVVPPIADDRSKILTDAGWTVITNEHAAQGQASSIKCAILHLMSKPEIDQVVIVLGDMPHLQPSHISRLLSAAEPSSVRAVMSDCNGVLTPPALFKRDLFERLVRLTGDRGAKSIFCEIEHGARTINLTQAQAIDIDNQADLERAMETENA
ncbi:MAG: NTP transferase domain-containing protein [Pseudomonadota bacterium]